MFELIRNIVVKSFKVRFKYNCFIPNVFILKNMELIFNFKNIKSRLTKPRIPLSYFQNVVHYSL